MGPREREFRVIAAAQYLLGTRATGPAIFREALAGEPDSGLWLKRDKQAATSWLRHRSGIPDASLDELRAASARVSRQAAFN